MVNISGLVAFCVSKEDSLLRTSSSLIFENLKVVSVGLIWILTSKLSIFGGLLEGR